MIRFKRYCAKRRSSFSITNYSIEVPGNQGFFAAKNGLNLGGGDDKAANLSLHTISRALKAIENETKEPKRKLTKRN